MIDCNLLLFLVFNCCFIFSVRSIDQDQSKNIFVSSKRLSIFIQNDFQRFIFILDALSSNRRVTPREWNIHFIYGSNFHLSHIHNAILEKDPNENKWILAMIIENRHREMHFTIIEFSEDIFSGNCVLKHHLSEPYDVHPFPIGIQPQGRYACVVELISTTCFNLKDKQLVSFPNSVMWTEGTFIFGQSLVITSDDRLFLLAYCLIETDGRERPETIVLNILSVDLADLSNPQLLGKTELSVQRSPSEYFLYQKKYSYLSLSMDDLSKKIIVGIACVNRVVILSALNRSEPASIIKEHHSIDSIKYFGKSVLMLDENRYAVLIPSIAPLLGCLSQIQFFSLEDQRIEPKPIFVFPNNQQLLQNKPNSLSTPSILSLAKWNSNEITIILDTPTGILIPSSSPGYYSGTIETLKNTDVQIYQPTKCSPGTYQNRRSLGPCAICPAETKNNGSFGEKCAKCVETKTTICFPGSKTETNITEMLINDELYPFPGSSDSTQFEDILLQNMLTLSTSSFQCFVHSPIFMASVTLLLFTIVYLFITLIFNNSKYKRYQIIVRQVFGHFDLITDKEHCFGGFITFSLLIIVICACVFSVSYLKLYPIEQLTAEKQKAVSCDHNLINAKFSSSLQLTSIRKHADEKPIFDLLETQPIQLNIQLISTNFQCRNLLIHENRGQGLSIPWTDFNCSSKDDFLNISTILSEKVITLEFDLNGPHAIGALSVCLSSPPLIINNGEYVASKMKHCRLYYNQNETLSSNPNINIKMVKIINQTISKNLQDNINYSATWLPIFSSKTFNDHLLFAQNGEYYRYLTSKISLLIDISQSEFYVKNTQEPIARTHEIFFTTILFSMLCLDLIALYFTIFRMIIRPFFYLLKKRLHL